MNDEASFVAMIAAHPTDETLKLAFADWLEEQGDPRAPWVRKQQIREWMGPTFQNPIPVLAESLAGERRVMEVRGACALIGEPVVPALIELLGHEKPRVRQQAAICLRKIGQSATAAVPALLALLKDPEYSVRVAAVKALKDIKPPDGTDTSQLRDALNDNGYTIRQVASQVLSSMRAKTGVAQELDKKLASRNAKERLKTIAALGQLGTADAVASLDRMLDDRLPEVRMAAVQALGQMTKVRAAIGPLCRALKDTDPAVRHAAAEQFGGYRHTPTAEAIKPLRVALGDKSPQVRASAAAALMVCGNRAAEAVPKLISTLKHGHPEVRSAAVRALGSIGKDDPKVLAALIPAIDDPDDTVAYWAVSTLAEWSRLPNETAEPLLRYIPRDRANLSLYKVYYTLSKLEAPSTRVIDEMRRAVARGGLESWHACEALAQIGPAAAAAIPELVSTVRRERSSDSAIKALVHIGGEGFTQLGELIESSNRLRDILCVLPQFGSTALPLLPAMLQRLRTTQSEEEMYLVLMAIGYLGPGATDAIPDLLSLVEGAARSDDRVVLSALHVLGNLAGALAPYFPRLLALSRRSDLSLNVRAAFARILAGLSVHHPMALEALREQLQSATPAEGDDHSVRFAKTQFRQHTASAFAALGPPAAPAVPLLITLLDDPRSDVRWQTIHALAAIGDPAAVPHICQAARSSDATVRNSVAIALGKLGDTSNETVAVLVSLVSDVSEHIRRHAVEALGKLRANTPTALEALRNAEKRDPDKRVRTRAAAALKAIEGRKGKRK